MYSANVKNSYVKAGRKKSIRGLCLKILLILLILSTSIFFAVNSQSSELIQYEEVTVQEGDTLWSIANNYNTNNQDTRRIISQIKSFNNLDGVILQPGQIIKIPS
ncbi:cell division suppressor protein YneA [Natronospora cellulosivora (SeqCode)]